AGGDKRGMQSAALFIVRKEGGYEGGNDRYVDIRVDEHPSPIEELERILKIYDMTLLSREDLSNLYPIGGPIAKRIQGVLHDLGFLKEVSFSDDWTSEAEAALQEWTNTENFENKWVDGKIWKSVLDYLFEQWERR
ncbi:MAG: putative peptidoglycan binding domain-containing protein, partial [Candidatus Thorarchaeota archaeon]